MAKTKSEPAKIPNHPLWMDHDYKTDAGSVLRITGVIRGNGGEIEYMNLSHPDKVVKRVSRDTFQQIVRECLGFKGSDKK